MVKKRPMGPGRRDLPSPRMTLQRRPRTRMRRLLFWTSDTRLPPEKRWWLRTLGVDCCAVQDIRYHDTTSPSALLLWTSSYYQKGTHSQASGAPALIPCSVLDGGTTSQRALSPLRRRLLLGIPPPHSWLPGRTSAGGALSPRDAPPGQQLQNGRSPQKARLCSRMAWSSTLCIMSFSE